MADGIRLINIEELRRKLGGRSRNSIFKDIEAGRLPAPMKFSDRQTGRNYWVEAEVDEALAAHIGGAAPVDGAGDVSC